MSLLSQNHFNKSPKMISRRQRIKTAFDKQKKHDFFCKSSKIITFYMCMCIIARMFQTAKIKLHTNFTIVLCYIFALMFEICLSLLITVIYVAATHRGSNSLHTAASRCRMDNVCRYSTPQRLCPAASVVTASPCPPSAACRLTPQDARRESGAVLKQRV